MKIDIIKNNRNKLSAISADIVVETKRKFVTEIEKDGWGDKYTKTQTDNKISALLPKSDLSSNQAGKGSSMVGIADVQGNFTSTDVEGALAEIGGLYLWSSNNIGHIDGKKIIYSIPSNRLPAIYTAPPVMFSLMVHGATNLFHATFFCGRTTTYKLYMSNLQIIYDYNETAKKFEVSINQDGNLEINYTPEGTLFNYYLRLARIS